MEHWPHPRVSDVPARLGADAVHAGVASAERRVAPRAREPRAPGRRAAHVRPRPAGVHPRGVHRLHLVARGHRRPVQSHDVHLARNEPRQRRRELPRRRRHGPHPAAVRVPAGVSRRDRARRGPPAAEGRRRRHAGPRRAHGARPHQRRAHPRGDGREEPPLSARLRDFRCRALPDYRRRASCADRRPRGRRRPSAVANGARPAPFHLLLAALCARVHCRRPVPEHRDRHPVRAGELIRARGAVAHGPRPRLRRLPAVGRGPLLFGQ